MNDMFLLFVRISIEASVLIGVILVLRAVFKKVPRAFIYCFWLVALLRLLCPVHIETDARVVPSAVIGEIVNGDWQTGRDPAEGAAVAASDGQAVTGGTADNAPVSDVPVSVTDVLAGLWLTGTGIFLLVYTGQYLALKKRLRTAVRAADGVWESDTVRSPLVMGLIRPQVYLPMGLAGEDRGHILAHERMHIRHLDVQVRVLGLAAVCLHWWNPVVWLAIRLMNQDMEMVCDESVLKAADIRTRKAYMRTLLMFSMKRSGLRVTPYFGETNTEKRIKHIMVFKKPTWIISGVLLLAAILCGSIFFIVPRLDNGDSSETLVTADTESPTPEPVPATDAPGQSDNPEMTSHEYLTRYSGYLDEVAMFEGAYDDLDYDGDGLQDRIYRNILDTDENDEAVLIGYRVDFGNGDTLDIGGFDDVWIGVKLIGYDLTNDGVNEIIYCGIHGASTFPPMGSEIAVFTKGDSGYEMLPLPRPDDWEIDASPYRTGFSIYSKDVTETSATLYSTQYVYEETIDIDSDAYEYCFKMAGNEPVGSNAWAVDVDTIEDVPALVLYVNIGFKYYERELMISLTWQDGEFKPVDIQ